MITHAAFPKHYYTVLLDRTLGVAFLRLREETGGALAGKGRYGQAAARFTGRSRRPRPGSGR